LTVEPKPLKSKKQAEEKPMVKKKTALTFTVNACTVLDISVNSRKEFTMAKTEYKLSPNEAIIIKQERIIHGGAIANFTDELILTNQNLVLISKGTFGRVKNIQAFPVRQIKVYNNQAQVILSKTRGGYPQIEVYLINGQENFGFESKKDAMNWINKINQLVTGEDLEINVPVKTAIPGTEMIADALGGTVDAFKGALGFKPKKSSIEAIEKVARKCSFCGAPVSGKKGQIVRCSYCDADQQL